MTPTQEQLEAMTDDQLNAAAAQALGCPCWVSLGGKAGYWSSKDQGKTLANWSPATNIADAMGLPMDGIDYRALYVEGKIGFSDIGFHAQVIAPRTPEGEARARTMFFLLTREVKP